MRGLHPHLLPGHAAHPRFGRRSALQAGAISLLGLGMNHVSALAAADVKGAGASPRRASVIYIFLSGGLAQIDSFDPKPDAPAEIRGEFKPIATRTPGMFICEHLPRLAARSHLWSVVRSLTHKSNDHSAGHHIMLTGRSDIPPGFDPSAPKSTDWPSIAAVAGAVAPARNNLPPAIVLPERLVHYSGRVIPGQFAGVMGKRHDPWFIEASPYDPLAYGAFPEYEFDHQERERKVRRTVFTVPNLRLPEGVPADRLTHRLKLLNAIDTQRRAWDARATATRFDSYSQSALSLLTDTRVRQAFDLEHEDPKVLDRYGRNSFGWSLLMARRLVEAGVSLIQVNLGNNETWDTHGNAFPHLKDVLFPPTDRAISALLDDLHEAGLLSSTMLVMAGEFGRTPKITGLPQYYKLPGRDHWGAVQSAFFAGGGVQGGRVIGSSDKTGGYPASESQTPERMAASIYRSLGLPSTVAWHDELDRPHHIYHAEPIPGLT